jgi:hypothetical protein
LIKKHSYCAKTNQSVVICEPITGRTHQIRVHLQYLGFPIANDPLYTEEGKQLGDDNEEDQVFRKLETISTTSSKDFEERKKEIQENPHPNLEPFFKNCKDFKLDQDCIHCMSPDLDPIPLQTSSLWLHSFSYESKDWKYETGWPDWATVEQVVVDSTTSEGKKDTKSEL